MVAAVNMPPDEVATPLAKESITKPIHTIILDSSPLLLNTPSISTLLANGHVLVTTPSVLEEMRGEEARSRIDTLYMPFLTVRSPRTESVKLVKEFARKTGDAAVLSRTDFDILALAYDIECERNGGDWRLRSAPGQKRLNGSPPSKNEQPNDQGQAQHPDPESAGRQDEMPPAENDVETVRHHIESLVLEEPQPDVPPSSQHAEAIIPSSDLPPLASRPTEIEDGEETSDSEDGWITPSNIKKQQAKDEAASSTARSETRTLQVATMTGDFAMQNVLLQMNLNLVSTKTCKRVAQIKQFILRCHACFFTTKEMSKQFCPRCGKPTLTRVSCTTNDKGEVTLHLKANMQWNNKGNVYSVPKPAGSSANQKWKGPKQGGGQRGWGNDLILAEDQKEYIRAMSAMKKSTNKDLMDEDTLPSILSGDREKSGGRIRIGAGRNVNARKR